MITTKTALLSAYDKTGLENFAGELVVRGWNILASSGTSKYLEEKGIKTRNVAEIVGEPILGHRVVTLSREIHAALLATDKPEDQAELERLNIPRIDLVYVNLYPLKEEIAKPESNLWSVIEQTDIGGPTLLRSAAKGRRVSLCRPSEFQIALDYISGKHSNDPKAEEKIMSGLTSIAENVVSEYCKMSSDYHKKVAGEGLFSF